MRGRERPDPLRRPVRRTASRQGLTARDLARIHRTSVEVIRRALRSGRVTPAVRTRRGWVVAPVYRLVRGTRGPRIGAASPLRTGPPRPVVSRPGVYAHLAPEGALVESRCAAWPEVDGRRWRVLGTSASAVGVLVVDDLAGRRWYAAPSALEVIEVPAM